MERNDVLGFISHFTKGGQWQAVIEAFTSGCCYWFAKVLELRFNGEIVYDQVNNHFAAQIDHRVYDITGDVTKKFISPWIPWVTYELGSGCRRGIERDCINFVR